MYVSNLQHSVIHFYANYPKLEMHLNLNFSYLKPIFERHQSLFQGLNQKFKTIRSINEALYKN